MEKLRQWLKQYQYLLLAIASFLVAGFVFLGALLHNMDFLRGVNAAVLVLLGVKWLKWHHDGPPEK